MSLVAFDTLKFATQLQEGNFTPEQARAMTAAMVEAMAGAELATKSDLVAVKTELKADIQASEHRLEKKIDSVIADIAAVRADAEATKAELKADAAATKAELKTDIAALDQRMTAGFRDVEQRMTIKLGGMLVIITGILLAAIRYLGH